MLFHEETHHSLWYGLQVLPNGALSSFWCWGTGERPLVQGCLFDGMFASFLAGEHILPQNTSHTHIAHENAIWLLRCIGINASVKDFSGVVH